MEELLAQSEPHGQQRSRARTQTTIEMSRALPMYANDPSPQTTTRTV